MQIITQKYRSIDSTRMLNMQFAKTSGVGIKDGFVISSPAKGEFEISAGSFLTSSGALVTETTPVKVLIPELLNDSGTIKRRIYIYLRYAHQETEDAPAAQYVTLMSEANENYDQCVINTLNVGSNDHLLCELGTIGGELSLPTIGYSILTKFSVISNINEFLALPISILGNDCVSQSPGHYNIDGESYAMYNTQTLPVHTEHIIDVAYSAGSGLAAINPSEDISTFPKIAGPAYLKFPESSAKIPITDCTIEYYDADNNFSAVTVAAESFGDPAAEATYRLPIGMIKSIKKININFSSEAITTAHVILSSVEPIFVVGSYYVGAPAVCIKGYHKNGFLYDQATDMRVNQLVRLLCCYTSMFGLAELVYDGRDTYMIKGLTNMGGAVPIWHFIGDKQYAVLAMDNESTEKYNNNDLNDLIGSRSVFKGNDYLVLYSTGSGDSTKKTDVMIKKLL